MRARHGLMLACALVAYGLVLVDRASADVTLTLTPDQASASVLSADGWTLTATGSGDVAPVLVLPGHGAGELAGDEAGDPVYGKHDKKTAWQVTDAAGAIQTGRLLSWPRMSAPFLLHVSVLTPPLAAWFHAGAGASWADSPVVGVAKGGQIDVQQAGLVNGGWFDASAYPSVFLEWDVDNTTGHPVDVVAERLGLPAGFSYVRSTLGAPTRRRAHSLGLSWSVPVTIPPHSSIEWDVWLDAPCAHDYGVVHARLQVTEADGSRDGTGNKGPALELEACDA